MGQLVTVREKPSSNPGVVRFEINRSLTGMGHERYSSPADIVRNRPVDEVARRLFEHGGVAGVHVNSSVITVNLAGGSTGVGMLEVIERLFKFYEEAPEVADNGAAAGDPEAEADAPSEDTSSDEATAEVEESAPENVAGEPEAVEAEEPAAEEPAADEPADQDSSAG